MFDPDRFTRPFTPPVDRTLQFTQPHEVDLSWLLGRGYAEASATKLVGDRHELRSRQREAVAPGLQRPVVEHGDTATERIEAAFIRFDEIRCVDW